MGVFGVDAKIVIKRGNTVAEIPTVAPSDDHTDGSWSDTDVYSGEFYGNEVDEKLFIRLGQTVKEVNLGSGSVGSSDVFVNYEIGGEWVYNGDSWRGLGDDYNIQEIAHSSIYTNRSYPFTDNANSDFGIGGQPYSGTRRFGHVVPFDSEITSLEGHFNNATTQNQTIAFAVIVMRLVSGTMQAVATSLASGAIQNDQVGRVFINLQTPIQILRGDHLVYASACELTQTTTRRIKGSFSVTTRKV